MARLAHHSPILKSLWKFEKEHHQTTSRINPQRRNVDQSQEALGQDSAQRHRRCSRQRIYDPFAQESMSIRRLQGIAWESNEGEALTRIQLHGVTFKKRAPRAIKEIKAFATKSMVRSTQPDPWTIEQYWEKRKEFGIWRQGLTGSIGHHRCSSRSPIEQEGLGGRYQGRSIQTPCPHLEKA